MSPRVSVLIPAYNAESYLDQAIASLCVQTVRDFEILVIDDGSDDGTAAIAEHLPGVTLIKNKHQGVAVARNTGIRNAKGEFIAFLDADDTWAPDKLEKQLSYLDCHVGCDMVFTQLENFFEGDEALMTPRQSQIMHARLDRYLVTACIRAEAFSEHGLFREDLEYGEDTEWMIRVQAGGVNMDETIEEPLYLRRIHDANISLTHSSVGKDEMLPLMAAAIRRARKKA